MGEPVPLDYLELSLPAPTTGWHLELDRRGIPIETDDIGRECISRADARELILERRESEARARAAAERNDAAIEARRLAQLIPGTPWHEIPEGVTAAEMWAQREKDARPRRESVLDHALSGGGIILHPLGPDSDAA